MASSDEYAWVEELAAHDWELPFEPPFDHPAADLVDGSGDEPDRSDAEVPHDAALA